MSLFGFSKPQSDAGEVSAGPAVFDVTLERFENDVIKASMQTPILVDFWAPWCGPCKQLMPVLEAEVAAAAGAVKLAKVNIDENPELAQAMQVQSVPTVLAFFQGQPVTGFQGAQPASQIKAVIDQLMKLAKQHAPDALDIPEALKGAADALAAGDAATAQAIYAQILQQDPDHVEAFTGLVRTFITAGQIDQAKAMIENAPEKIAKHPNFESAKTALDLAMNAPSGDLAALVEKGQKDPKDHQAKLDLAQAHFAAGHKEEAIETLLDSIALDKDWNEQEARKTLLTFFDALGPADPLTVSARKKLSSLLFS